MKISLLALSLFFTTNAFARTEGRFLGVVGFVAVTDRKVGQVTDEDPQRLYAGMNVAPSEEGGNTGKKIELADKKFSLLCVDRGAGGSVCSMTVKAGSQGVVAPSKGLIRFVALGGEAAALQKLFYPDPSTGRFEYFTQDQALRIASDSESFVAEFLRR